MKVFDYESSARLQRMRNHMAMDKLAKIERGRYGWTHYNKGSKADEMPMLRIGSDGKATERA